MLDHLHTLNELTPKIRCKGRNGVDPSLIFGLESRLFLDPEEYKDAHHEEVETARVQRHPSHHSNCLCDQDGCKLATRTSDFIHARGDHYLNVELEEHEILDEQVLTEALAMLSKEVVWRVKGFVRLKRGVHILNWAFGRYELTCMKDDTATDAVSLTVMGERGAVKVQALRLAARLDAVVL